MAGRSTVVTPTGPGFSRMSSPAARALVTRTLPSFEATQLICPVITITNIPKPMGRTPKETIR
jgi:hypothetical protein